MKQAQHLSIAVSALLLIVGTSESRGQEGGNHGWNQSATCHAATSTGPYSTPPCSVTVCQLNPDTCEIECTTTYVTGVMCYTTTTTGNANEQWCVPLGTYIFCSDTTEPEGCTWTKTWWGCSFNNGPVQYSATEYGPRRKLVTLL